MRRLDGVGAVDHLADAGSEREERHDVFQARRQAWPIAGVALASFVLELLEPDQRHVGILGPVDCLDGQQDRRSDPSRRCCGSGARCRSAPRSADRGDRLGKALEPIDHRDQDIIDATRLQAVDDLEPEFGAFGLLNPQAQNLLLAVRIERQRDIDGLVPDHAFIANLDPQGVEKRPG